LKQIHYQVITFISRIRYLKHSSIFKTACSVFQTPVIYMQLKFVVVLLMFELYANWTPPGSKPGDWNKD